MIEEIFKQLDEKFRNYHPTSDVYKYKKWNLVDWIYYGSNTGIDLIYRTENKTWQMRQVVDSGYVQGKTLIETDKFEDIEPYTDVFAPTNDKYKTDRK